MDFNKLSWFSIMMLFYVGAMFLVIMTTPQYPLDPGNKYVWGPVVILIVSVVNDYQKIIKI